LAQVALQHPSLSVASFCTFQMMSRMSSLLSSSKTKSPDEKVTDASEKTGKTQIVVDIISDPN